MVGSYFKQSAADDSRQIEGIRGREPLY